MKEKLPYVLLVVALLVLGGSAWHYLGSSSGSPTLVDGVPVVCQHCQHFFVIDYGDMSKYPKGPNGEGLKCKKCGKFGASPAKQCETCKRWYRVQGKPVCPYCNKNQPIPNQRPGIGAPAIQPGPQ